MDTGGTAGRGGGRQKRYKGSMFRIHGVLRLGARVGVWSGALMVLNRSEGNVVSGGSVVKQMGRVNENARVGGTEGYSVWGGSYPLW